MTDKRNIDLLHNGTPAGLLVIEMLETVEKPSFIDYLRGGMQINLYVAIDYTASNGEMSHPNSLHYLGAQN